ncbi:hypothetical protein JAO29_11830 [Edaphobacter sp. HDX4]|uniref:hypothetical protein n=1 Tax=Edaphobacter sp. HDX4 TaxID=2794064 RepID=UPI002FE69C5A
MPKILVALTLLALSTPLFAKDPFAGTWKLNAEKSRYTAGTKPSDVTIVIEDQGNTIQVTATGTYADSSPLSVKYTMPAQGGQGTPEQGDFDAITAKMINDHVRELRYMKNGQELRTRRLVVSKDGKTMTTTVNGTDPKGNKLAGTDVFDRQ